MTETNILLKEIEYYEEQLQKEDNKRVSEYLINKIYDLKQELQLIEDDGWDIEKENRIDIEGYWHDVADFYDFGDEIWDRIIYVEPYYLKDIEDVTDGFVYGKVYKVDRIECREDNDYWVIVNSLGDEVWITSQGLMFYDNEIVGKFCLFSIEKA